MITIPRLDFYALIFLMLSFLVPDAVWELIFLHIAVFFVLLSMFYSIYNEYHKRQARKIEVCSLAPFRCMYLGLDGECELYAKKKKTEGK